MWRFFLAATLLVAAFIFAITLHKMSSPNVRVSAPASGTPSPARRQGPPSAAGNGVLSGDAPWALSALPDCARQHEEVRGAPSHVEAKIPRDAHVVEGHLDAGPCSLFASKQGIEVRRGGVRLRIPPPARLLHAGDRYYLYTQDRKGALLRVYTFE